MTNLTRSTWRIPTSPHRFDRGDDHVIKPNGSGFGDDFAALNMYHALQVTLTNGDIEVSPRYGVSMQYLVPSCRQLQYRFLPWRRYPVWVSNVFVEQVCDRISQTGCLRQRPVRSLRAAYRFACRYGATVGGSAVPFRIQVLQMKMRPSSTMRTRSWVISHMRCSVFT